MINMRELVTSLGNHTDPNTAVGWRATLQSSTLRDAITELPEFPAAAGEVLTLSEAFTDLGPHPAGAAAATQALAEEVADQGRRGSVDIPTLLALAGKLEQEAQAHQRVLRAITDARLAAQDRLNALLHSNANSIRSTLNEQLQELLTEARKIGSAPRTADQAIDSGRVKEFQRSQTLIGRYADLRAGQQALDANLAATLRSSPHYLPAAHFQEALALQLGDDSEASTPWPDLRGDPATVLAWTVKHPEAGAWVPTASELATAVANWETADLRSMLDRSARNARRMQSAGRSSSGTDI